MKNIIQKLSENFLVALEKSNSFNLIGNENESDERKTLHYKSRDFFGPEYHHTSSAENYGTFLSFNFDKNKLSSVTVSCSECTDFCFQKGHVQICRTPAFKNRAGIITPEGKARFSLVKMEKVFNKKFKNL